jgi:TIGR03009 family protein
MLATTRHALAALAVCLLLTPPTNAQQQAPLTALPPQPAERPQPGAAPLPATAPQIPPGFGLNPLEQAYLDGVLSTWEVQSGKINTFKCDFERWEYNPTFGPGPDIPLNKDKGELSFQKPDKGSFQITEIRRWTPEQVSNGQQPQQPVKGDWLPQKDAIGEHWVCDGKSVYEYRHDQKQLVERPIPPDLQGKAIVDGPLPFLFGAEAKKLKERYWLKVDAHANQDPNQIWLIALPRFQAQAANFRGVRVILDRRTMMPTHMEVHLPDGSRHLYMFDVANASINAPFAKLQQFFQRPQMWPGWKRVVEQPLVEQAAQPAATPR